MLARAENTLQQTLHFIDDVSEAQAQADFPKIIRLLVENSRAHSSPPIFSPLFFYTVSCLYETTRRVKTKKDYNYYCNKYLLSQILQVQISNTIFKNYLKVIL